MNGLQRTFLYGFASLTMAFAASSARAEDKAPGRDAAAAAAPQADALSLAMTALEDYNARMQGAKPDARTSLEGADKNLAVAERVTFAHITDRRVSLADYARTVAEAERHIGEARAFKAAGTETLEARAALARDAGHFYTAQDSYYVLLGTDLSMRVDAGTADALDGSAAVAKAEAAKVRGPQHAAGAAKILAKTDGALKDAHINAAVAAYQSVRDRTLGEGQPLAKTCAAKGREAVISRIAELERAVEDNLARGGGDYTRLAVLADTPGGRALAEGREAEQEKLLRFEFQGTVAAVAKEAAASKACSPRPQGANCGP